MEADGPYELFVDWDDVVFKFECFGFELRALDQRASELFPEAILVDEIVSPSFTFTTEWERPAAAGEVDPRFGQTVRSSGLLQDIPAAATDMCVSRVCISWLSGSSGNFQRWVALYHDVDGIPTHPVLTDERHKIDELINSAHTIELDSLDSLDTWYEKLKSLMTGN